MAARMPPICSWCHSPPDFYGLTISSGKGLLWYSPPIILAIVGWWPFWRRWHAEALLCLGIVLAHFAFYGRIFAWHGDGSWGPRYLMVMLPFAILPLVALLEGLRRRPIRLTLVSTVVAAGIVVQLLGVLVNFDWYILRSDQGTRHFSPPASPILVHARMLDRACRGMAGATLTAARGARYWLMVSMPPSRHWADRPSAQGSFRGGRPAQA